MCRAHLLSCSAHSGGSNRLFLQQWAGSGLAACTRPVVETIGGDSKAPNMAKTEASAHKVCPYSNILPTLWYPLHRSSRTVQLARYVCIVHRPTTRERLSTLDVCFAISFRLVWFLCCCCCCCCRCRCCCWWCCCCCCCCSCCCSGLIWLLEVPSLMRRFD